MVLKEETCGMFHESTYHFATTYGKEQHLRQLSVELLLLNNCQTNDDDQLEMLQVTEAYEHMMYDQQQVGDPHA